MSLSITSSNVRTVLESIADAIELRYAQILFGVVAGSHLYNLANDHSDVDYMCVYQIPTKDLLGLKPPVSTMDSRHAKFVDKAQRLLPIGFDIDWVFFEVGSFISRSHQPRKHECLHVDQEYSSCFRSESWKQLCAFRRDFSSVNTIKEYLRYAKSKLRSAQSVFSNDPLDHDDVFKRLYHVARALLEAQRLCMSRFPIVRFPMESIERERLLALKSGDIDAYHSLSHHHGERGYDEARDYHGAGNVDDEHTHLPTLKVMEDFLRTIDTLQERVSTMLEHPSARLPRAPHLRRARRWLYHLRMNDLLRECTHDIPIDLPSTAIHPLHAMANALILRHHPRDQMDGSAERLDNDGNASMIGWHAMWCAPVGSCAYGTSVATKRGVVRDYLGVFAGCRERLLCLPQVVSINVKGPNTNKERNVRAERGLALVEMSWALSHLVLDPEVLPPGHVTRLLEAVYAPIDDGTYCSAAWADVRNALHHPLLSAQTAQHYLRCAEWNLARTHKRRTLCDNMYHAIRMLYEAQRVIEGNPPAQPLSSHHIQVLLDVRNATTRPEDARLYATRMMDTLNARMELRVRDGLLPERNAHDVHHVLERAVVRAYTRVLVENHPIECASRASRKEDGEEHTGR